jgi:hypothetical protein
MTLPKHQHAIIDLAKLRDYVLNPDHPRGKHKARVFLRTLGFDWRDAETLARQISHGLASEGCEAGVVDEFGQRFQVTVSVKGRVGSARVRTGWILLAGERYPRLTTCFIKD